MLDEFTVVIPIKGTAEESSVISRTLPCVFSLCPSEVILAIDKPVEDASILSKIVSITQSYNASNITRILEIEKGGWKDQQMKARYNGFLEAKHNKILQVDIDLIVNKNVLKAIRLVGKDNIGLVSCSKLTVPYSIPKLHRTLVKVALSLLRKSRFVGLYVVWKPFWQETETIELARQYTKTRTKMRNREALDLEDFLCKGDDSHLKELMIKKHRCVHLKTVGALVLTDDWGDRPFVQYCKGVYFSHKDKILYSLIKAIVRLHPYHFCGCVHGRRIDDVAKFVFSWHKTEGGANA